MKRGIATPFIKTKKGKTNMKSMDITIKQIENRSNEFVAYLKSEFLGTTFALFFIDNLFGSVALAEFSEMIRFKYDVKKLNYVLSEDKLTFQTPALLDILYPKLKKGVYYELKTKRIY